MNEEWLQFQKEKFQAEIYFNPKKNPNSRSFKIVLTPKDNKETYKIDMAILREQNKKNKLEDINKRKDEAFAEREKLLYEGKISRKQYDEYFK